MNTLQTALWITVFGMGFVFAALLLIWGTMVLLTKLTAPVEPSQLPSATDSPKADSISETEYHAQAAALGVALAIAEQQLSAAHPLKEPPTALISAWQLGMRTRQMYQKGTSHRRLKG